MKLFGSSKKSKHAANGRHLADARDTRPASTREVRPAAAATSAGNAGALPREKKSRRRKSSVVKKVIIIVCIILGLTLLLLGGAFAVFRWEIDPFYDMLFPKPDEVRVAPMRTPRVITDPEHPYYVADPDNPDAPGIPAILNPGIENLPIEQVRSMEKITFLILGVDGFRNLRSEGGANTDVIMIVSFDMETHKIEVVNIMRDTIVNVPWTVKKANSIYAGMMSGHRGETDAVNLAMEDTKEHFADLLGFNVDFWVMLDMEAFVSLVNAMPSGGVRFNVPQEIHMVDPDLSLDIHLYAGDQFLDGREALGLVRYRGYGAGDFGRIEMQHKFLKAAAEQVLAGGSTIDPVEYARIFLNYVRTDMELNYLARVGREMLKVDGSNIGFHTAPCSLYTKRGTGAGSYVRIHLDEWLELVNDKLNPFYHEITPLHVSILTLNDNNKFYVTDGHWQGSSSWGG